MVRKRAAVLLGADASSWLGLLIAAADPDFPVEVVLLLSNGIGPLGVGVPRLKIRMPIIKVDHRPFGHDRAAHEAEIAETLEMYRVEIVCIDGYMRLLTPFLVDRYAGRMLNIHGSLLPAFPGLRPHERALAAGVKLHGCTVHLVTHGMNDGPILAQAAVPVLFGDDPGRLAMRVGGQANRLYPAALAAFATGGRGVPPPFTAELCNPVPEDPAIA